MRKVQNWFDKFCYKHPKFGIPNLMLYIIIGTVIVYLLDFISGGNFLATLLFFFERNAIFSGQVWRILTFIFIPPNRNVLFFAIFAYFYYFLGSTLEREWGSGKFTLYYGTGMLFNIILGFCIGYADVFYLNISLLFAFAALWPNMRVLLFFVIPVKMKWIAWFNGAFFVVSIVNALSGPMPILALIPIVAILNFLLFFAGDLQETIRNGQKISAHNVRHAKSKTVDFHAAQQHVREKKGYLHKCAVCGKTDVTNPEKSFRYCSKCNGYYCYCDDHIFTHEHVE